MSVMSDHSAFRQAEVYAKASETEKVDGCELMTLLDIKRGQKVLDFGCGTGNLTKKLADLVGPEGQVVGVDPDQERIQLARKSFSSPNLTYYVGSLESIPGDNYDIVYSCYVMPRCKNKEEVFEKMASILKKGGKFGFVSACYVDIVEGMFQPTEAFSQEIIDSYSSVLELVKPEKFADLAAPYFGTIYWRESNYVLEFTDVEKLVTFYQINTGLGDRKHINVEMLKSYYSNGGALSVPSLWAVLGKK